MSSDVRERIFEPFYSTKGLGEGTGMGLTVVRGIVEDHGGAISVESELDQGTTFRVYLPAATTVEELIVGEERPSSAAGSERILLLEDDETLREPLCAAIARLGYCVDSVTTPAQVLEQLVSVEHPYDALVLDEHHLGGNGDGLIGKLRHLASELAIVVCTRYSDGEWQKKLGEIGPHAVVLKPISPTAIGAALREIYPTHTGAAQ